MTEILEAMLGYARENYRSYYDDVLTAYLIATSQKEQYEIESTIRSQVLNIYKKRQGITDDIDERAQKAQEIQELLDESSMDATAQFMANTQLKPFLNQQKQEIRKGKEQERKQLLSEKVKEKKDQFLQAAIASAVVSSVGGMNQGGAEGAKSAMTAAFAGAKMPAAVTVTTSGKPVSSSQLPAAAAAAAVTPVAAAAARNPVVTQAAKNLAAGLAAAGLSSSPLSVASSVSPVAPAAAKLLSSEPPPKPTSRPALAARELNIIKGIIPHIEDILNGNEADSFDNRKKTIDSFRGEPGTTLLASINTIIGVVKSLPRKDKHESLVKQAEGFKDKYLEVTTSDEEITDAIAKKELIVILDSLNGIINVLDRLFTKKGKGGARKTRRAQKTRRRRARKTRR
jgi:hypothetical protein